MIFDLPYSASLAAVLALVPAGLRWWWGRALAPLADDPAFPERLVAHRHRTGRSFGVALALLLVLVTRTIYWSLPLLILSCIVASFQFRRTIYRESWSLAAYLSFVARAAVAIFGFWLLLVAVPALAAVAGSRDWLAALALGIVLFLWNSRYADILRFLLRSTPVENQTLVARFVALANASTAATPRFEQVPLAGGRIANAIALPSLRGSAVLFTDTLLARLDEDESVAICGHELAHLEHYNPRRLRRLNAGNMLLIAGSLAAVAVARATETSVMSPSILWPCVVLASMAWRVRHRQQHETESDLRAVALTGDPDALARALTNIYAYAHVPRRVDAQRDQQNSHPSLARRIKAIRAAMPGEPTAPGITASFAAPDGRVEVTFGNERLEWREGDAAIHSLSYAHLTELRLHARPAGPTRLLVVERGGRRWDMALADGDVARAQGVLDLVDGRLADSTPSAGVWPATQRVFTLLAVSVAVLSGQMAVMVVALIALARPAAPLAGAAGAALIAAAALTARGPDWAGLDLQPWLSLALVGLGGFLFWTAWKSRGAAVQVTTTRLVAGFGVLSALTVVAVFFDGTDVIRLHQSARSLSAVVVWPLALAGALACYPSRRARVGAVAALLTGLTMAVVGSVQFMDRFGKDPLLLPSAAIAQVHVSGAPAAEYALPFYATDVRLSPDGAFVAAQDMYKDRRRDDSQTVTFQIGRLGGALAAVEASDVVFLNDDCVLTLEADDEGTEIVERPLSQPEVAIWRRRVAGLFDARLSVERAAGQWRLLGWDADRRILRARGAIGGDAVDITTWTSPADQPSWAMTMAASGDAVLVLETRYEAAAFNSVSFRWAFTLLRPTATVSHLWRVTPDSKTDLGVSYLAANCHPDVIGGERMVCTAYDGTRTRIVAIDPATSEISAVATLDGRFASNEYPSAGWLTGWYNSTPVALRLTSPELVTLGEHPHALMGFTTSDRWLGTITAEGVRSTLRLFPHAM